MFCGDFGDTFHPNTMSLSLYKKTNSLRFALSTLQDLSHDLPANSVSLGAIHLGNGQLPDNVVPASANTVSDLKGDESG